MSKFLVDDGCWLWTGSLHRQGYGLFRHEGKTQKAHRVMYELLIGPIPVGLELDHLCRNPQCIRPDHLEPVSHAENVRRGRVGENSRVKTHCPKGHPYAGVNVIIEQGRRVCRSCRILRDRSRRAAQNPRPVIQVSSLTTLSG